MIGENQKWLKRNIKIKWLKMNMTKCPKII